MRTYADVFRVRCPDYECESHAVREAAYAQHLERMPKQDNHFLQFFGHDFFHDGNIEEIRYLAHQSKVELCLWGPNIRRALSDAKHDFLYVAAKFTCVFSGVARFNVTVEEEADCNRRSRGGRCTYEYGEMDTLLDEIAETADGRTDADERPSHSLLFVAGTRCGTCMHVVQIVFAGFHVEPSEPLAFELMRSASSFKAPLYDIAEGPIHSTPTGRTSPALGHA